MPGGDGRTLRSSETFRIPEELAEFLSRDTYSLMIKGGSGTGKTILALTILRALQPLTNVLYVSTRTSPLQLVQYYPWIEEIFGPAKVEGWRTGAGGKNQAWENLIDSRLDEPNTVFERVTNVLMDEQAPTVVIDSWEALSDSVGSEALRTNIRVLETWRERAGARFIFVGEDPTNSAIDYMLEGVVILKEKTQEGRRLREVTLSKLHGIRIRKPSHFFTLDGGVFKSFPDYSPENYQFQKPMPETLDRPLRSKKGRFPTGYKPLDALLKGGYPSRSVVLLQSEDYLDTRVVLVFLSRMIQDWIVSGDRVFVQIPQGTERRFVSQFIKSFSGKRESKKIVASERGYFESRESDRTPFWSSKGRLLVITSSSFAQFGEKSGWSENFKALRKEAELILVMVGTEQGPQETSKAIVRLRFLRVDGTLFLQSEVPWSPLFAVIPGLEAGNPSIRLEPMV